MSGNTCTWGHVTQFGTLLRLRLITMGGGGVARAWQGDINTYCLVFLSESVVWTHLGYFLRDSTTLQLRVEVRCMHHTEHDWLELWIDDDYLLSVCWTSECLCKLMIFFNVFLLWLFDFCINFFYNKLTPRNFCTVWLVPVMIANLYSWEQNDNSIYEKWDSFVEPSSRRDDVGIILGESCVLLISSSIAGSIILFVELRM